jgi:hypothetical protein
MYNADNHPVPFSRNVSQSDYNSGKVNKRSLEKLLCALSFIIEVPGVNWKKEVGSKAMGASIGIILRNYFLLDMSKY